MSDDEAAVAAAVASPTPAGLAAASSSPAGSSAIVEATASTSQQQSPPAPQQQLQLPHAPDALAPPPGPQSAKAKGKRKTNDADDEEEEEDDEDDDDDDDDDDDEDGEDEDEEDDDDDDDEDDEEEDGEEADGEEPDIADIGDGLDAGNIIEARPRRKAAAKVTDYTSEEAIRKAGVAPTDAAADGGDDEELDASYLDPPKDASSKDASKPPPKKKRRAMASPSPDPLPKPPPARPTVRMQMIKTQGAGSADQVTPPPIDPEDDPDLYIMEIPHIMLEQLRGVQHPWATWVEETQKAAQDAQRAEQEKEEAERQQEQERRQYNAAQAALNAAAAANGAGGAAGSGEAGGSGGAGPPVPGAAPAIPSDLPPGLAALLARHQENPRTGMIPKKRKKREVYDVNDPFVDDSELTIDEPTHFVQPKNSGFYVCIGDVEVFRTTQQKARRKRGGAAAAAAAAAGEGAAGPSGKEKGKAANAAAAGAGAASGTAAQANGHAESSAKVTQSALASSAKASGAAGAMDMLLAMRAKQTGLTVSEHVVAGVQRPDQPAPPAQPPAATASARGGVVPMEGVVHMAEAERSMNARRQSEGSRMQPIPVDDSTDDESKPVDATSASGVAAAAGPASSGAGGSRRTLREKSPVKALAAADGASGSGMGLRRTPRRSASSSAGANEGRNGGTAASALATTAAATASTPEPSAAKSAAMRDISISMNGTPGGSGDISISGVQSTPSGSGAGANATGSSSSGAAVQANGKKHRYPCLPVHPKLAQAFQELKEVVAKEPFEVKTKFPAYLKPPLVRTAKLALELGEYNDNFFNWLPTIFPYNRFTMMKLTKREFFEEHTNYYRDLQEENLAALKTLVERGLPHQKLEHDQAMQRWLDAGGQQAAAAPEAKPSGSGAPGALAGAGERSSPLTPVKASLVGAAGGDAVVVDDDDAAEGSKAENGEEPVKRWRWDEEMRAHLHTCITAENAMVELYNEKQSLENTNKPVSEMARRKALYKRIASFWAEDGWASTSIISREYTRTKSRYEKQAARAAEEAEAL
ncbi:hypothetical protein OC835_003403 [Tilletia horrida]|nr:hypothetical protein OC835_003403 [Tilletia horrida]